MIIIISWPLSLRKSDHSTKHIPSSHSSPLLFFITTPLFPLVWLVEGWLQCQIRSALDWQLTRSQVSKRRNDVPSQNFNLIQRSVYHVLNRRREGWEKMEWWILSFLGLLGCEEVNIHLYNQQFHFIRTVMNPLYQVLATFRGSFLLYYFTPSLLRPFLLIGKSSNNVKSNPSSMTNGLGRR